MKKLLALVFLAVAVLGALGQSAIQRNIVTTNAIPAGANGQVLVLLSGVPRWSTNAGSVTFSNVTIYGTLMVNTTIVINATGAGNLQLFATNGVQSITLSAPDAFSPSYTLYLPTTVLTNAVLQSTSDGHLYWSTDPVLTSVEVNGSGAGYLLIGDASTTNTMKLIGPAAFSETFTNYLPSSPGTNSQVLTMGTNGQWYFSTPVVGTDTLWTNIGSTLQPAVSTHALLVSGDRLNAGSSWAVNGRNTNITSDTRLAYLAVGNMGVIGETAGIGSTEGAGVFGASHNPVALGYGVVGVAANEQDNSAVIGVMGTAFNDSVTNAVQVGGSFEVGASFAATNIPPASASVLLENRGADIPLILGRINGVDAFLVDRYGALTPRSTVENVSAMSSAVLDVHATNANYRTLTLAGDTVFSSTNRAAGHWITAFITGAATNCAVSWPSWHWMNQTAPTTLAAGKVASLTVFFTDGTDAAAIANYAVEP